jgi:hypothetical protein
MHIYLLSIFLFTAFFFWVGRAEHKEVRISDNGKDKRISIYLGSLVSTSRRVHLIMMSDSHAHHKKGRNDI